MIYLPVFENVGYAEHPFHNLVRCYLLDLNVYVIIL